MRRVQEPSSNMYSQQCWREMPSASPTSGYCTIIHKVEQTDWEAQKRQLPGLTISRGTAVALVMPRATQAGQAVTALPAALGSRKPRRSTYSCNANDAPSIFRVQTSAARKLSVQNETSMADTGVVVDQLC